jgi:DNA-binding transcriptional LysR family regulator
LYGSLPGLIRNFRESNPGVALDLFEMTAKDQLNAFQNGTIDLGFQVGAELLGHSRSMSIYHDVLIACLPEQDPVAKSAPNRPLPLRKLERQPIVMFPRTLAPRLYDTIVGYADAVGITLSIEQEAVQMQTIIGLVSSGIGCAIVPGCMTALQRPGIVYRQLTPKSPAITTDLVWSNGVNPGASHHERARDRPGLYGH